MSFISVLNESAVTYVPNLASYWPELSFTSGWEAISPVGEIKAFATYAEAQAWRITEVIAMAGEQS